MFFYSIKKVIPSIIKIIPAILVTILLSTCFDIILPKYMATIDNNVNAVIVAINVIIGFVLGGE